MRRTVQPACAGFSITVIIEQKSIRPTRPLRPGDGPPCLVAGRFASRGAGAARPLAYSACSGPPAPAGFPGRPPAPPSAPSSPGALPGRPACSVSVPVALLWSAGRRAAAVPAGPGCGRRRPYTPQGRSPACARAGSSLARRPHRRRRRVPFLALRLRTALTSATMRRPAPERRTRGPCGGLFASRNRPSGRRGLRASGRFRRSARARLAGLPAASSFVARRRAALPARSRAAGGAPTRDDCLCPCGGNTDAVVFRTEPENFPI